MYKDGIKFGLGLLTSFIVSLIPLCLLANCFNSLLLNVIKKYEIQVSINDEIIYTGDPHKVNVKGNRIVIFKDDFRLIPCAEYVSDSIQIITVEDDKN